MVAALICCLILSTQPQPQPFNWTEPPPWYIVLANQIYREFKVEGPIPEIEFPECKALFKQWVEEDIASGTVERHQATEQFQMYYNGFLGIWNGSYDDKGHPKKGYIMICRNLSKKEEYRILIHELTHDILAQKGMGGGHNHLSPFPEWESFIAEKFPNPYTNPIFYIWKFRTNLDTCDNNRLARHWPVQKNCELRQFDIPNNLKEYAWGVPKFWR